MEIRLIDANDFPAKRIDPNECLAGRMYACGWNGVIHLLEDAPTIDPETLPIVQELRKEVQGLQERLERLKYWDLERQRLIKSSNEDRAAVNVMRKHCEKTIAELREQLERVTQENLELKARFCVSEPCTTCQHYENTTCGGEGDCLGCKCDCPCNRCNEYSMWKYREPKKED